jgi:hypothetical protein
MPLQFKYKRSLKVLELLYYAREKETFKILVTNFLKYHALDKIENEDINFPTVVNYLNSISYIMVERFLMVYFFYFQLNEVGSNGMNAGESFNHYDVYSEQILAESQSPNWGGSIRIGEIGEDVTRYRIGINDNNILYCKNIRAMAFRNLFVKPKNDPRCFINPSDFEHLPYDEMEQAVGDDKIEYMALFKSMVGKKIESPYKIDLLEK